MAAELSRLRLSIATKEQQSIPRCRRLFELTPELADVPPNWATALAVADTDATCKLAEELGGKVLVSPVDLPKAVATP